MVVYYCDVQCHCLLHLYNYVHIGNVYNSLHSHKVSRRARIFVTFYIGLYLGIIMLHIARLQK